MAPVSSFAEELPEDETNAEQTALFQEDGEGEEQGHLQLSKPHQGFLCRCKRTASLLSYFISCFVHPVLQSAGCHCFSACSNPG